MVENFNEFATVPSKVDFKVASTFVYMRVILMEKLPPINIHNFGLISLFTLTLITIVLFIIYALAVNVLSPLYSKL